SLSAVIVVHVLHLMPQRAGKRVFTAHQPDQPFANKHMAAGKSKRIHEVRIRNVVELVIQLAPSPASDNPSHFCDVRLQLTILLRSQTVARGIALRHGVANANFVSIRKARELGGNPADLALRLRQRVQHAFSANLRLWLAPLAVVEGRAGRSQNQGQSNQALHKYSRSASRLRPYRYETTSSSPPTPIMVKYRARGSSICHTSHTMILPTHKISSAIPVRR